MNIENVVELAKIEADVDILKRLENLNIITEEELENKLGDVVVDFMRFYSKGKIDSALSYEMAVNISNKIEFLDNGEGWWTLYSEAEYGEDLPSMEKVLSESPLRKKDEEERLARENSAYRVYVNGASIAPVDDMHSYYGTYQSDVTLEAGTGANSVSEALELIKQFQIKTVNKNADLIDDNNEPAIGYFTPASFVIENAKKESVIGGLWDKNKESFIIPDNLTNQQVNELKAKVDCLNDNYNEAAWAENRETCKNIIKDINKLEIQILNADFYNSSITESDKMALYQFNSKKEEASMKKEIKPSSLFDNVSSALNENYQKRLDALIDNIQDSDRLIISDSLYVKNKIKPGLSDEEGITSHREAGGKPGDKNSEHLFIISGKDFKDYVNGHKSQVIEMFRLEDLTTFQKEFEAGTSQGAWHEFHDKLSEKVQLHNELLVGLQKMQKEQLPEPTLKSEAGFRPGQH